MSIATPTLEHQQTIQPYEIAVPAFAGPLDLLLHLIERDELDITALSLANVTNQYLAQVEALKEGKVSQLILSLIHI